MKKLPTGALTVEEKHLVKGFLNSGWRNQDIQALLNVGRISTINSARITEVKQDDAIDAASSSKLDHFEKVQRSFNAETGLNPYKHERLIRAREAMIMAVHIFNGGMVFKTEAFSVMANIA